MRAILGFFLLIAIAVMLTYASIAMLAGKYSASPIVQLIGPGDLPSICAKRANSYFERNEHVMRQISDALIASERFTDVWVTENEDPTSWLVRSIDDEADVYDDVDATQEDVDTFLPMFAALETDSFYSPVLFVQGEESVAALQHAATCGPSIFDWVKFRTSSGEPTKGRPHAFAVGYAYWPNGVRIPSNCDEPLPDFDATVLCEVTINENWLWFSRWAPEHVLNIVDNK